LPARLGGRLYPLRRRIIAPGEKRIRAFRLGENDEVLASWDEMIDAVAPRSGMWVGRAKYSFVRCFVEGFGVGRGDDVLGSFQRWLSEQPQHSGVKNYAWWFLVLREVFDHGKEDDLAYPGDDALVIDHLFARLREFLLLLAAEEGLARYPRGGQGLL
jgi:hypothetical protein